MTARTGLLLDAETALPIDHGWIAVLYFRTSVGLGELVGGVCLPCWCKWARAEGRYALIAATRAGGGCG